MSTTGAPSSDSKSATIGIEPPLRIMALLTAAGVDARPEWEALKAALDASPVPVEVRLFVSQDDLKLHLDGLNDPRVTAEFLPGDFDLAAIVGQQPLPPHIIHFFCHGSAEGGATLHLATRADQIAGSGLGSVAIEPNDLRRVAGLDRHLWLVTLNCCQGAAAPIEKPITGPPGVSAPSTVTIRIPSTPDSGPSHCRTNSCGRSAAI